MAQKIKYSDFTPDQRSCIAGKIPILIKEGKDQDQAIAVAISMCTENQMGHKEELKKNCCPECAQGNPCCKGYDYQKNDNGTFTVFNVPIMAEVPKGEKGNARRIGPKWMRKAVHKAQERWNDDGYKAPLHVEHHGGKKNTESAGFIIPTDVRKMTYQKKPVWAIFADLEVREDVFDNIQQNKFPYRSVEIFAWDKPEVNSLALLSDEVPYFRFDLLRLGDEKIPVKKYENREPVVACREFANGSAILFSFGGGQMATEEMIEERQEEEPIAIFECAEEEEVEVEEEEKEEMCNSSKLGVHLEAMSAVLSKIAEKLGVGEDEEEEDEEEVEESEQIVAPVEQSAVANMAALSGKVAALEARERIRLRREKTSTLIETAMTELAEWHPDESTRENMETLVSSSTKPSETVRAFVESYKTSVPKYPAATMEEFDASFGAADPPEVLKYAAEGADALALAREASTQFDELESKGLVSSSRESFVTTQLSATTGDIVRR